MRILVLTFYFPPDLSAGSFRTTAIVDALLREAPDDAHIDVVTTLPNRYESFSAKALLAEKRGRVSIHRIPLKKHRSGTLDQSASFADFARGSMRAVRGRRYDVVFATSGRLMTAVLGAWIARRTGARLYLDIRDIFVDNLKYIVPGSISAFLRPVFSTLERWTISSADKVNLVSPGFTQHFVSRYPHQRFSYFTNGIDEEFVIAADAPADAISNLGELQGITVVYAGNIGEGQGLHNILPLLAARLGDRVRFRIIGDGGRKNALHEALRASRVTNVELLPPVGREQLIAEYGAADVLFLHLNDYESFKTVLPSKVFEYAASGKPLWAGVAGYAADFVRAEIPNAAVFEPCDVEGALRALRELTLKHTPRPEFIARYNRASISSAIALDTLALVARR